VEKSGTNNDQSNVKTDVNRIGLGMLVIGLAFALWVLLVKLPTGSSPALTWETALDLGKKFLGFATSLAGVLGIAVGGTALLGKVGQLKQEDARVAVATTVTGLGVTLAGGAMVGVPEGPQWAQTVVQATVLVVGVGAAYMLRKS